MQDHWTRRSTIKALGTYFFNKFLEQTIVLNLCDLPLVYECDSVSCTQNTYVSRALVANAPPQSHRVRLLSVSVWRWPLDGSPSLLPSAVAIANECYDDWSPIEVLDPAFRNDIDAIAGHFHAKAEFETIFVNRLVPWNKLAGAPNAGHAAIADFLISRGAFAALFSNFDPLSGNWAIGKKIAMRGALDGHEAGNVQSIDQISWLHAAQP